MFNLNKFVMNTLYCMFKGNEDEYKVRKYALNWYSKDVLTDDDMSTIDNWYTSDNEGSENSNGDFVEDSADMTKGKESEEV